MNKIKRITLTILTACVLSGFAYVPRVFAESELLCDGVGCASGQEIPMVGTGENVLLMILSGLDITCKTVTSTGDITGPKTGKVLTVTESGCTGPFGVACTESPDNLPWNIELVLSGAQFVTIIKSSGIGTPGNVSVCGGISTLCELRLLGTLTEDYGATVTNIAGGVLDVQSSEAEEDRCFEGSTELANDGFILGLGVAECLDPTTLTKLECAVS
jgi:hypothetical protein